jgi:hypothetical protein
VLAYSANTTKKLLLVLLLGTAVSQRCPKVISTEKSIKTDMLWCCSVVMKDLVFEGLWTHLGHHFALCLWNTWVHPCDVSKEPYTNLLSIPCLFPSSFFFFFLARAASWPIHHNWAGGFLFFFTAMHIHHIIHSFRDSQVLALQKVSPIVVADGLTTGQVKWSSKIGWAELAGLAQPLIGPV